MNLILILGDQLNHDSDVFRDFDSKKDAVAMVEVKSESRYVWSHKVRTAFFLSSMRHFAQELREKGIKVYYQKIDDSDARENFIEAFSKIIQHVSPQKLIVCEAGEYRVQSELEQLSQKVNLALEVREDSTFFCSKIEFESYCRQHPHLRMEFFYREQRRKHNILMSGDTPLGGKWNYDQENRRSFGKDGPDIREDLHLPHDSITSEVMLVVNKLFPDHPGGLEHFNWPVTSKEAEKLLKHFIKNLLPHFGEWQDAMWEEEPFLFHSKLSAAMNVKLLNPKKVVKSVEHAYSQGSVPLASAEGFIRQILGWREYVRGVYFKFMPEYLMRNFLGANKKLPAFYWTGKTHMHCMSQVIKQTLDYGYAHHIQRLMVTGLFSLLYGVHPKEIHAWYLAVYLDAVEWVELPNTLGMSQYADGGVMGSKPYIASGKYIKRMSNYCKSCRYDPDQAFGENACPFTTLYWDFVRRHRKILEKNPRLGMQVKNWDKKDVVEKRKIAEQAGKLRSFTKEVSSL